MAEQEEASVLERKNKAKSYFPLVFLLFNKLKNKRKWAANNPSHMSKIEHARDVKWPFKSGPHRCHVARPQGTTCPEPRDQKYKLLPRAFF